MTSPDGFLIDFRGDEYALPALIAWEAEHSAGKACDAFEVTFAFAADMLSILRDAIRFRMTHAGETVFCGVVDEFEISVSGGGRLVTVRGRGLGALLLDNEAEAAEYYGAGVDYIIARHVTPFGIDKIRRSEFSVPGLFAVSSGASQWGVLREFCRFGGGVTPRFAKDGTLLLNNESGDTVMIDGSDPVSLSEYRERRYGVVSRVLVKNPGLAANTQTVNNAEFIARGGNCRRVITMPRISGYDAQRFSGKYQIEMSREGSVICALTARRLFAAFAGDMVRLDNGALGLSGEFMVSASRCFGNESGFGTEVELVCG